VFALRPHQRERAVMRGRPTSAYQSLGGSRWRSAGAKAGKSVRIQGKGHRGKVDRSCGSSLGRWVFLGLCAGEQRVNLSNLCKLAAREEVGKQVVSGRYPMCRERDFV
jgi:hypothetical protein